MHRFCVLIIYGITVSEQYVVEFSKTRENCYKVSQINRENRENFLKSTFQYFPYISRPLIHYLDTILIKCHIFQILLIREIKYF